MTMANFKVFAFVFSVICITYLCSSSDVSAHDDKKVYTVYMGSKTEEYSLSSTDHLHILRQVLNNSTPEEYLVRSYGKSFNGFAARLSAQESEQLKRMTGVVSVFASRKLKLQTTRSWDFIGLPISDFSQQTVESDVIIGVLDSGIWPESPSFADDGMSPAPKKWKGVCDGGLNFTCNNKIIGARVYNDSTPQGKSARDSIGHGSHTASIAAGRVVNNTNFYGLANGTARGGAPLSRIAVYQVCVKGYCEDDAILAGFDDAISDGVDLISISISDLPRVFEADSIAVGAFHAAQKGVLTLQSAGNYGNSRGIVGSVAPWIFTVGASNMGRLIIDKIVLGDGTTLNGSTINTFSLQGKMFPLVHYEPVSNQGNEAKSNFSAVSMEGKIMVCDSHIPYKVVKLSKNAAGVVAPDDSSPIVPFPAVFLSDHDYDIVLSYLDSKRPEATIYGSQEVNDSNAPFVALFSSRGGNVFAPDILKPDIVAPGVQILAAYSPIAPISEFDDMDKRKANYSILTGTSMACPHVAGAAAYVKAQHPDWSPSAVKSALMTTANPMSPSKNIEREFAYGAGHINPVAALDPGLVYETNRDEYITFMCNLDYTDDQIQYITGNKSVSCPEESNRNLSPNDVNYPTMSAKIDNDARSYSVEFSRTVTNVGTANSTYTSKVEPGSKFKVTVEPNTLSFRSLNEKKSFKVTVVGEVLVSIYPDSGSLVWSDGTHNVRSPIAIYTNAYRE